MVMKLSVAAIPASTSVVTTQVRRGRRSTAEPMRVQIPPEVSGTPYRGIWGQKTPRGTSTSRAGSSVSIATRAQTTPAAQTGPRPRVALWSAASRQSSAATTVAALATMAGAARFQATVMAATRFSWRVSSSR